jgi:AcrR family transcriptional regulator
MSSLTDQVTERILQAALTLFARHGFQRTSLADVAVEAAVARATLYARFKDKRALFEGLAQALVAAWDDQAGLAANLEATILAKDLPLFRLLHASPHGADLLAVDATLTRVHAQRLDAGFADLLARRAKAAAAAGADLAAFGGADGFGRLVATAGAGLKHETHSEADYLDALHRFCAVLARAARPIALATKEEFT